MISRYSAHNLTWVDLQSPTSEELYLITEEFDIPSLVGQELIDRTLNSKMDLHSHFLYLILHFPQMKGSSLNNSEHEIDFIVGEKFLITIHYEPIGSIAEFAKEFEKNSIIDHPLNKPHGSLILMQLIKILYGKSLSGLDEMTMILRQIENKIFSSYKTNIVRDISKASKKLLDFKQSLRFHGEVLGSYESASKYLFGPQYSYYAERIVSEYKKVHSILENHREVLAELQKTHDSLLSSKSNEIMKNFTVMTFVMLPLTLITGVFGMNTIPELVFIKSLPDFYLIIGSMIITGIIMFLFFKIRRWI